MQPKTKRDWGMHHVSLTPVNPKLLVNWNMRTFWLKPPYLHMYGWIFFLTETQELAISSASLFMERWIFGRGRVLGIVYMIEVGRLYLNAGRKDLSGWGYMQARPKRLISSYRAKGSAWGRKGTYLREHPAGEGEGIRNHVHCNDKGLQGLVRAGSKWALENVESLSFHISLDLNWGRFPIQHSEVPNSS